MEKKNTGKIICSGVLAERFALMKTLGVGGNAKVKLAYDLESGKQVAVKVMNASDENTKKMVEQEAETMNMVDHPNVLKVIKFGNGTYKQNNSDKTKDFFYVALDLCQQDTLFDYIVDQEPFPESMTVHFMEQFLKGLQAIHLAGQAHRDIKCENILVDDDHNLKIADFGFAANIAGKINTFESSGKLYTRLGTQGQIAPEIQNQGRATQGYDGKMVDVFNAAIIFFCMLYQRMPFGSTKPTDKFYKYIYGERPDFFWEVHRKDNLNVDSVSEECRSLLAAMLAKEPHLRPSISEILAHPWFTKTKRMEVHDIKKEFDNRRGHMQLIRQKEEELAQKAAQPIGQAFRSDLGDRRFYAFHKFERTMFQVQRDPKDLFEILFEQLNSLSDNEPIRGENTFKIKHHFKQIQKDDNKKSGAEDIEIECLLSAKLVFDEPTGRLFVEFQHTGGDMDMFNDSYKQIRDVILNN